MRRLLPVLAALAALVSAVPAAADLRPVRRDFGELHVPRVRAGEIRLPQAHERGRIQVLVQLSDAPLARHSRSLSGAGARQKLQADSGSSRQYLAYLARRQQAAVAQLRRAVPKARVQRRYRIVLNGFSVGLPARDLPKLVALDFVRKVSPSVRYTLTLNESPAIIKAGDRKSVV